MGWCNEPGATVKRSQERAVGEGACHPNQIPYDGYCYGTMDYMTESPSQMTKGRDQSHRYMSIPTDCELAPPDSSVVQNVVKENTFATTMVVFADGSGFGTAMSNGIPIPGFGPGLKYEHPALPSLLSHGQGKWATAIGHAKVFLRCKSAETAVGHWCWDHDGYEDDCPAPCKFEYSGRGMGWCNEPGATVKRSQERAVGKN